MIPELNCFWSDKKKQQDAVVVILSTIRFNYCKCILLDFWCWEVFEINTLIKIEVTFSNCLSLFFGLILSFYPFPSFPLFCFLHLPPPLSFLSVSRGWGRSALQLPSSEPGWHHHIAASSLGVPIHHPDHHRQHQQHHLRMHTHTHRHTHLLQEDKREGRIASLKERGREPQRERVREREEEGRSCWGRQKPLTCALPTIHLNKPQYRQIWWVRLQATEGKQQHKKQEREDPSTQTPTPSTSQLPARRAALPLS